MRAPRFNNISEGNYYHVTARGAGRRAIFEDDVDRRKYLDDLFSLIDETTGSVIAWCLMSNHVHLLLHLEIHELSALMHRLHTKHGQAFNGRHGHVGPVFQARYGCVPIHTEEQLLQTVRYIHRNPKDLDSGRWQQYPWSSYHEYLGEAKHCDTRMVLNIIGGQKAFREFHEEAVEVSTVRIDGYRRRLNDAEATAILTDQLGLQFTDTLISIPTDQRDRQLAIAYKRGLSIRQLERLTGIGRYSIEKAVSRKS